MRLLALDDRLEAIAGAPAVDTTRIPSSEGDGDPLGIGPFVERTLVAYAIAPPAVGLGISRFGPQLVGYARSRVISDGAGSVFGSHVYVESGVETTLPQIQPAPAGARLTALRVGRVAFTVFDGHNSASAPMVWGDGYTWDLVRLETPGRLIAYNRALTDGEVIQVMGWLARRYGIIPPP